MNTNNSYSIAEIAKKLTVNQRTIQREIARGKLKAFKVGRKFIISDASLSQYLGTAYVNPENRITEFCQKRKDEMVNLLQKLVSIPSESNSSQQEEVLAKFIRQKLESFGIRTVIHGQGEAVTVQATYGYADRGILLDCPLDTTPAGDLKKWTYPPYEGVVKEGKMFGRGTADCKAGMVAMIYALLALQEFIDESKVRVELVFDGGEQNGVYHGMRATLNKGLPVDAGIIGYAGEPNRLAIGARGYHRYTFICHGQAAHTGSSSKKGISAISKMAIFINEMEQVELPKSKNKYFPFGSRLVFSLIEGGRAINIVPDECKARLDVRTTPELKKNSVDAIIQKLVNKIKRNDQDFEIDYIYDVGQEGYVLDDRERIVTSLQTALKEITGTKPTIVANGPAHIGNLLYGHGIPVVVRGPEGGNVHSYDEYVKIDSIPTAAQIYFNTILHYFDLSSLF